MFGYRTRDSRNNLWYTKCGKIVYPAGTVGVVHDTKENTQRFFHGSHKEDITALAMHPNGRTVATGDVVTHDDGCYVFIWDSQTPEDASKRIQLRIGDKKLGRGVADTEFSGDGKYLSVIAMDAEHTVSWKKKQGHHVVVILSSKTNISTTTKKRFTFTIGKRAISHLPRPRDMTTR